LVERPAELETTLGSFGAGVKDRNESSQAQTLATAGFARALSSRRQRTDSLGKPAGFGAAERKVSVGTAENRRAHDAARDAPVKILWKPVPQYTDEAREKRIEGDVVLLVRFLARGMVETIRVIGSLGHGLDEHAVEAAGAVRFEPAIENDKPVDFVAQMRIRFELAY
jgi:TonB family protein